MSIIPFKRIILISPLPKDEIHYLLSSATKSPEEFYKYGRKDTIKNLYKFSGIVSENRASISKKVSYPQNFLPRIDIELEEMPKGTLLQVQFSLFYGSLIMLVLGSIITLFLGVFFLFVQEVDLIAYGGFVFFMVNYVVALGNFNMHCKDAKKTLEDVITY